MTIGAAPDFRPVSGPGQVWRRLVEAVWKVEHAFERAKASDRAVDDTRLRIFLFLVLFSLGFAFMALQAGRAALMGGPAGSVLEAPPPSGARADLVDRNGALLAVDLTHWGLYLDPRQVWDKRDVRRGLRAALPRMDRERLMRALAGDRRVYLLGGLTPADKERAHDLGLPGVEFEEEARRVYPLGASAAHLIGYADTAGKGLAGAEKALDGPIHDAAASGQPVALALDLRVQAALQDEVQRAAETFHAQGALGVVTDVHTGEILGMTSWPSFDPNAPGAEGADALVDRVAARVYEPGSVFKVFTLAMGLDACGVTPETRFDVHTPLRLGGQTIHDYDKGDTVLALSEVFTHSSNIGAGRLGLRCGAGRMARYFGDFGLFKAAPSELAESARPIVQHKLTDNAVASMAFGSAIAVSPLALATGMNAIFNDGVYVPLTIRKLAPGQAVQGRRVIQASTSRTMLDLMRLNVLHGTGTKADALGLRVGGKTGSQEKVIGGRIDRKKLVSSFAAVFPTDGAASDPRYFVLVMLDEPQATKETAGFATGGWTAAPTAGRVIDRIAPFLGVARAPTTPFDAPRVAAAPLPEMLAGATR